MRPDDTFKKQTKQQKPYRIVSLVLYLNTVTKSTNRQGKANLSHDGLNQTHVPYWWLNKPTHSNFCMTMKGRADNEGSKSDVARIAQPPQASYPKVLIENKMITINFFNKLFYKKIKENINCQSRSSLLTNTCFMRR